MQAQLIGNTVDECVLKSLEKMKKLGSCVIDTPVSVRLINPLARFSVLPTIDPAIGVVYSICLLAGANIDEALNLVFVPSHFSTALKRTKQGMCLRRYKPGSKALFQLKNAGSVGEAGEIDQLKKAVEFLKKEKYARIVLHDPEVKPDASCAEADLPFALNLRINKNNTLSMTVFVDAIDVCDFSTYLVPVYTCVQEIIAMLAGVPLDDFTVIAESMVLQGNMSKGELDDLIYDLKLFKRVPSVKRNVYQEKSEIDLRYIDNSIRYLGDFINRVQDGDLVVANPFANGKPLQMFYDYAEVLRANEAIKQNIKVDGVSTFIHPHLAYYYDQ